MLRLALKRCPEGKAFSRYTRVPNWPAKFFLDSLVSTVNCQYNCHAIGQYVAKPRVDRLNGEAAVVSQGGLLVPVHEMIIQARP